jgi:FkbM family methyltransferase
MFPELLYSSIFRLNSIRPNRFTKRVLTKAESLPEFQAKARYYDRPFYFPSQSMIGNLIARGGVWDAMLPDILECTTGAPRVVIEVGSNIGASIIPIKNRFPAAELVLIEPVKRYADVLAKNMRSYSSTTIIRNEIIGEKDGDCAYICANKTTGTPSKADYGHDLTEAQWLPTITIDSLSARLGLGKGARVIDFLKVDTDGYEERVFKGAQKTILANKPLIFFEFSPPSLQRIGEPANLIRLFREQLLCRQFVVMHFEGSILGVASSFEEIVKLKGADYYVDLLTTPENSPTAASIYNRQWGPGWAAKKSLRIL